MFRELCGDKTLKNVVLVTNMWTRDPPDTNEARETELSTKFFKPVLDKGAQFIRHHDTAKSTHDIIRKIVANHPVVLQIQRELVDEHRGIIDTSAGQAVNRELNEQAKRHRAELEKVEKGMMQALKEKDEETRQELEDQARTLREQMMKIEKESKGMAANYVVEKERMEAKMRKIEQEAKKERERAEAEHKRQLADLGRRLRDADDVGGRNWKDDSVPVPGSKTVLPVHDHGGSAPNLAAHQQNDRLAQVVLGVYFGRPIMVRNGPLWYWVTVAILWNAGLLVCCGAGAGVYLFLLQRSLSCEVAGLT